MAKKFIIIDGHALLHRAWHALPALTSPRGQVVNALYGFTTILFRVLRAMRPDYLAVAWDRKEPTWRHKAYKAYKAQREKQPEELYTQIDPIKKLLEILHIPSYDVLGFEADDVIAALARQAEAAGVENIILTGDLDTLQLVTSKTKVLTLRKGITDTVLYDEKAVTDRYGLEPEQLIDFKALRGDPSDNLPGVKGIGEKGATELLKEFGSIEEVYKHLDKYCDREIPEPKSPEAGVSRRHRAGARAESCKIRPNMVKSLRNGQEAAFFSKKLVTLARELDIKFSLEDVKREPLDMNELVPFLIDYGFRSLVERLSKEDLASGAKSEQGGLFELKQEAGGKKHEARVINTGGEFNKLATKIKNQGRFAFKILVDSPDVFEATALGVAIAFLPDELYLLDVFRQGRIHLRWTLRTMREIFEDENIIKVGHDLKNDYKILKLNKIELARPFFDCLIASYILNPGNRTHDLNSLALRFLGEQTRKPDNDKDAVCEEARLSLALYSHLEQETRNQNFTKLLNDIEFALIPILAQMELYGILIDSEFLRDMSDNLTRQLAALAHKIHKLVGSEFNINSPQQLADILFNKLKLVPKTGRLRRGKTGISTAASELEKLRGAHPVIDSLFLHRELAKLKSTYVDALPALVNSKTGRVHTTYNQAITATGRLSSSDPNLQNIPIRTEIGRVIRKAFIAPRGFSLIGADYSQFELRIAATIANDQNMIEAFKAGADIHTDTAARVWGLAHDKVTPDMRRAAKTINFGILYGMGYVGLAESAGITPAEAKKFIEKYFVAFPSIKNYVEETKALARSLGYVETIFGRRRYLPEIVSEIPEVRAAAERMAVNMPIQGSQADLIKIAMIRLHETLLRISPETKMLLQVHDELVFEAPTKELARVSPVIKEIMEGVYKLKVPIVVDLKAGKNWGELKEFSQS